MIYGGELGWREGLVAGFAAGGPGDPAGDVMGLEARPLLGSLR